MTLYLMPTHLESLHIHIFMLGKKPPQVHAHSSFGLTQSAK